MRCAPAAKRSGQDCYDYALPAQRNGVAGAAMGNGASGHLRAGEKFFDGTACDAADQLAGAFLAQLTPPWSRWFGFRPGRDVLETQHGAVAAELDAAAEILHAHSRLESGRGLPDDPNRPKLLRVQPSDAVFLIALQIAARALAGSLPDITHGARHYHALQVAPSWAQGRTPCVVVGRHAFYIDIT